MKIAWHFDTSPYEETNTNYAYSTFELFSKALLRHEPQHANALVYWGDILIYSLSLNNGQIDNDKFTRLVEGWLFNHSGWRNMQFSKIIDLLPGNIFTICATGLDKKTCTYMNNTLSADDTYLGMMEVDETSPVHWAIYTQSLSPKYRIFKTRINILWDGISKDAYIDDNLEATLLSLGYTEVDYESLNLKHTIFDKYDNFEHAKRVAELKSQAGDMLVDIAEEVIAKFNDYDPKLAEMLVHIFSKFHAANDTEELADVTLRCRRLFCKIIDTLYPPTDEKIDGRDLGKEKHTNRLYAFIKQQNISTNEKNLIRVDVESLDKSYKSLIDFANKGIHADLYKPEVRRCIMKTIVILHDIASTIDRPLKVSTHVDTNVFNRIANGIKNRGDN